MSSFRKLELVLTSIAVLFFVCGCTSKTKPSPAPSVASSKGPDLGNIQWTTLARADFAGDDKKGATFLWDVPGTKWEVTNEMSRIKGTTTEDAWKGTRINVPVSGDDGDFVEVSGDFKVAQSDGHYVVALFGQDGIPHKESLCMLIERTDGKTEYRIQTNWAQHAAKIVDGNEKTPGFGDESKTFHKMKMILDRSASKVYYYVDDVYLGTVQVDGRVVPIVNLQMDFESSKAGTNIEILYDNLMVRSGKRQNG